jgi:hypothetical protein
MNNNLVPTVITDVNGRTTTVHKKLLESPTSPWSTPPPPGGWTKPQEKAPRISPYGRERSENPIGTPEEHRDTVAAIRKLLEANVYLSNDPWRIQEITFKLIRCKDGEHLKRVQGVLEAIAPEYATIVVSRIESYDADSLDAAYSYRDLITDDNGRSMSDLMQLHKNIMKHVSPEMDENGGIKHFAAHLYAKENTVLSSGPKPMGSYGTTVDNEDYVALVDQYADSVIQLAAYVSERGFEDFDHDDFAEYLSNGPIAEGWL